MDTFSHLKSRPPVSKPQKANTKTKLPIFFSQGMSPMEQIRLALVQPIDF